MTPRRLGRILILVFAAGATLAATFAVSQYLLKRADGVVAMRETLQELRLTLLPLRLGVYSAVAWFLPSYLFRIAGMDPAAPEHKRDLWIARAVLAAFALLMESVMFTRMRSL